MYSYYIHFQTSQKFKVFLKNSEILLFYSAFFPQEILGLHAHRSKCWRDAWWLGTPVICNTIFGSNAIPHMLVSIGFIVLKSW